MKTKALIVTILLAAIAISNAQENPIVPSKPTGESVQTNRIIGVGFKSFNLLSEILQSPDIMPGNKIVVTINPLHFLRIQPEFGYYQIKEHSRLLAADLVDKSYSIGLGAFGMWQKEKTNLYAGLKYILSKNINEDVQSAYNPNPPYSPLYTKTISTLNSNTFGLVVGGEYLLSKHFSVGSEIGFLSSQSKVEYSADPLNNSESTSLMTETNLLLRFYF